MTDAVVVEPRSVPSSTGVPSWNDVGAWNAGTPTSTRFSVSFRGDASVGTEPSGPNVPRPILALPALEATRSVANTLRAVTDEVVAVKQAATNTRSSDARTSGSPIPTRPTSATSPASDATTHVHAASNDSCSSTAHVPPSDIALLCRSIDVLTDAVRRLDRHLDRLLEVQSRASEVDDDSPHDPSDESALPPLSSTSARDDHEALERDLDAVLAEVVQVRSEGAPHAELARLRRRQADILARLLALDNHDDVAINLRLVSAESGPALRRRLA